MYILFYKSSLDIANRINEPATGRLIEHKMFPLSLSELAQHSNQRNEIKKGKKVYFYDNGIRNAILSNFAPLELRTDAGMLWENFMISERVKRNAYTDSYANLYFRRTHDQKEIDLIEEEDGLLRTYEFKWNPRAKATLPQAFATAYPNSTFSVITPESFWPFVS